MGKGTMHCHEEKQAWPEFQVDIAKPLYYNFSNAKTKRSSAKSVCQREELHRLKGLCKAACAKSLWSTGGEIE
jgi:hypothetical protein